MENDNNKEGGITSIFALVLFVVLIVLFVLDYFGWGNGRYPIASGKEGVYILDTKTGRCWHESSITPWVFLPMRYFNENDNAEKDVLCPPK